MRGEARHRWQQRVGKRGDELALRREIRWEIGGAHARGGSAAGGGGLQLCGLQRQRVCSLQRACSPQLRRLPLQTARNRQVQRVGSLQAREQVSE